MKRRLLLLAFAFVLGTGIAVPAAGSETDSDLVRVRENIAETRSRISSVAAARSRTARQLIATEEAIAVAEREFAAAAEEMASVRLALELGQAELASVQDALVHQLEKLAATRQSQIDARNEAEDWVVEAYMSGGPVQPTVAFDASGVGDVSVGVAYLEVLAQHSSSVADLYSALVEEEVALEAEIRQSEEGAAAELANLESLNARFVQAETAAMEKQERLELAYADLEAVIIAFESEIDEFEGELAALQKQESSIRAEIAAAAAAEVAASQAPVGSGMLVGPVPGSISSGFGMRVHPITGQNRMHNGVDIDGVLGDPIRAAKAGTVILAGVKGGYGNTTMIDHGGGMVTLYAHQSEFAVSVGSKVSSGEVIGYVGSTGQSTGPHLHFEVRINGVPRDPVKYL